MAEKAKIRFNHSLYQLGQDSEFFLWNPIKQEVIPSYKYFEPRDIAKKICQTNQAKHILGDISYVRLKRKYNSRPFTYTDSKTPLIFRDGLAVEVNTNPTNCRAFLFNGVRYALLLSEPWSRVSKERTYTSRPWVEVSQKLMNSFPEDLKVLGCSPSLDAYEEREKTVSVDPLKTFFRTSGSHLHMSFYPKTVPPDTHWGPFIRLADLLIGVPFTYIFRDELEFKRRKLYGQAGEFRFQNYSEVTKGLEYRVLSSRLWDHTAVASLFLGIWKFGFGNEEILNRWWQKYDPAWEDDIRLAINTGDEKALDAMMVHAMDFLREFGNSYNMKFSYSAETNLHMFKLFREANLRGDFKDAGIYNDLALGDAHVGFSEWLSRWNNRKFMEQQNANRVSIGV